MNTASDMNGLLCMLVAGKICSIVHYYRCPHLQSFVTMDMFSVAPTFHTKFDKNEWILLPTLDVLEEVRDFIESVSSARQENADMTFTPFREKVSSTILKI